MFMGRYRYQPSQGSQQFRRTLYAFWRRSAAPTFLFDSSQRRVCEVRPRRTNTPLHALTLLNDLTIREASRELAFQALRTGKTDESRLSFIMQCIISRPPSAAETQVLLAELHSTQKYYHGNPKDAMKFLDYGQPENRRRDNLPELAAYTVIASMIFNLDEAMTHE